MTCNVGTRQRKRRCDGNGCLGPSVEKHDCSEDSCEAPEAVWTTWTSFGSCTVTCGTGHRARFRHCIGPMLNATCEGAQSEIKICILDSCNNS